MKVHPAAEIFPMLEGQQFIDLVESIRELGLQEPIIVQGEVLIDGRNRLKACELAGVTPSYKELGAKKDPVPFIISRNINRRHLTPSQRAMAAAELSNLKPGRQPSKNGSDSKSANLPICEVGSQKQVAEMLNVSTRSVTAATKIKNASPELAAEVASGKKTVNAATKELAAKTPTKPKKTAKPAPEPDWNTAEKTLGLLLRFLDQWTEHHGIKNGTAHCLMIDHLSKFREQFESTRKGLA